MKQEHAKALCEMAGFFVSDMIRIPNEYLLRPDPKNAADVKWCQDNPWWLVFCKYGVEEADSQPIGILRIGRRKRVLSIHWDRMHGLLRPPQTPLVELVEHGKPKSAEAQEVILNTRVTGLDFHVTYDEKEMYCHAWGYQKALEYIHRLRTQHSLCRQKIAANVLGGEGRT